MEAHLIIVTIFAVLSAVICLAILIWVIYRATRTRPAPAAAAVPPRPPAPVRVESRPPTPGHLLEPRPGPTATAPVPVPAPSINLWTESQLQEYGFLEQDLEDDLGLVYGTDCAVCSDLMDGRATIAKIKRCNHSFHRQCISQWYAAQASNDQLISCPICRCPVTKQHIFIKMRDLTTHI